MNESGTLHSVETAPGPTEDKGTVPSSPLCERRGRRAVGRMRVADAAVSGEIHQSIACYELCEVAAQQFDRCSQHSSCCSNAPGKQAHLNDESGGHRVRGEEGSGFGSVASSNHAWARVWQYSTAGSLLFAHICCFGC